MAKKLDFNSIAKPSLDLTMKDPEKTVIRVGIPTTDLVEELTSVVGELEQLVKSGDKAVVHAIFDMAARLMSCNRDGIKITAEQLQGVYALDLEEIVIFFSEYMDFIAEIKSAKNS